jgi:hypothetical protein
VRFWIGRSLAWPFHLAVLPPTGATRWWSFDTSMIRLSSRVMPDSTSGSGMSEIALADDRPVLPVAEAGVVRNDERYR